jgi:hypothetical protein
VGKNRSWVATAFFVVELRDEFGFKACMAFMIQMAFPSPVLD